MIAGIGVDIVHVPRMQQGLERYGDRLARRILTKAELLEFSSVKAKASFLAKRFAAKEAAVKALGMGFRNGLRMRDIGVTHDDLGKPMLAFTGTAEDVRLEKGITAGHVSLADEKDYAIAFVSLQTRCEKS